MKKILSAAIAATVALASLPLSAAEVEVVTSGHKINAVRGPYDSDYICEMRGLKWWFTPETSDTKTSTNFFANDERKSNRIWVMVVRGVDDHGKSGYFTRDSRSMLCSIDVHCGSWTYDASSATLFDGYFGNGQIIKTFRPAYDLVPVPGTIADIAMTLVCPKQ